MASHRAGLFFAGIVGALLYAHSLAGQTFTAYDVPAGTVGNQAIPGISVGNDFRVIRPITITELGVFDSGTNGIQGSTVLTVQLYERSGRHAGTLLETLTFDAANPGERVGGSLFKPLPKPLTLLPGNYTIAAYGFDETKPYGNAGTPPYSTNTPPLWTVNDGGGLIRFEGLSRFGRNGAGQYPGHLDRGPVNRFAAGTFAFSAATLADPPHAADYAALTAGVGSFPLEDTRHLGSIAVLTPGSFPVLVEMGGNRKVLEAAGTYNSEPSGARAVAFANRQWGQSLTDARATLFENAIQWAARKSDAADIVMGVTTNLNLDYFRGRGYQVTPIIFETLPPTNSLPTMDVLVADWDPGVDNPPVDLIKEFTARGGGLVMTLTPRFHAYPIIRPSFNQANAILQSFGLAYRSSLATPADYGFTNIQVIAYPPYFSAYPAAQLLHWDRVGQMRLGAQEKAIALNTITYAVQGRPDLLSSLTAVYSTGTTNTGAARPTDASMGSLVDVTALAGAQANSGRLGRWGTDGNSLVALDRRGGVEYQFNVPTADVYQLQIEGSQNLTNSSQNDFDLVLSVDGENLGHQILSAGYGTNGVVTCWTPYLLTGSHTLRVYWDGAATRTALRINAVRVQTALGRDSDGNGLKDWVDHLVHGQSGLDVTNEVIGGYVSPICLEGRDPYLSLMAMSIEGADNQTPALTPQPAPNGRWYVNVPLSAYANAQTGFQVTYQNGALTETRRLQWMPLNLLTDGDMTIRKGDSLLFTAKPPGGPDGDLGVVVGTNQLTRGTTTQPRAYRFANAGLYTITGTYTPAQGAPQSRSITVNVVEHGFTNNPDCWVGKERDWDLPSVATQVVLEADSRLFVEQTATLADNGRRLSLLTDQNEPRYIISRLGDGGPILDSARANGFRVFAAPDTYNWVMEQYPDGSRLVETMVILSRVPPDVTVQVRVIVGGVTFDDGTTYRELTSADFDALGRYKLRFILPASARSTNCHSITIIQWAADVVGTY
jgi:hypothetical protein